MMKVSVSQENQPSTKEYIETTEKEQGGDYSSASTTTTNMEQNSNNNEWRNTNNPSNNAQEDSSEDIYSQDYFNNSLQAGGPAFIPQMPPNMNNLPNFFPPGPNMNLSSDQIVKLNVRGQVEFYFSQMNLTRDNYMQEQMDEEGYIPISVIARFKKIQQLTSDMNVLIDAISEGNGGVYELSEDKTKIKATWKKPERNTIIIREAPEGTTEDEIKDLLKEFKLLTVKKDVQKTWFVSLDNEDDAKLAMMNLLGATIHGEPVKCRLKSETVAPSPAAPAAATGAPNPSMFDPYMFPVQPPFFQPQQMSIPNYPPQQAGPGGFNMPPPFNYAGAPPVNQQFPPNFQWNAPPVPQPSSDYSQQYNPRSGSEGYKGTQPYQPRPRAPYAPRGGYKSSAPGAGGRYPPRDPSATSYRKPGPPRQQYPPRGPYQGNNPNSGSRYYNQPADSEDQLHRTSSTGSGERPGRPTTTPRKGNAREYIPSQSAVNAVKEPEFKSNDFPSLPTTPAEGNNKQSVNVGPGNWAAAVAKPVPKASETSNDFPVNESSTQNEKEAETEEPTEKKEEAPKEEVKEIKQPTPVVSEPPAAESPKPKRGWERPEPKQQQQQQQPCLVVNGAEEEGPESVESQEESNSQQESPKPEVEDKKQQPPPADASKGWGAAPSPAVKKSFAQILKEKQDAAAAASKASSETMSPSSKPADVSQTQGSQKRRVQRPGSPSGTGGNYGNKFSNFRGKNNQGPKGSSDGLWRKDSSKKPSTPASSSE